MSRIGKLPIVVPKGIKVKVDGASLHVEGPKGKLDLAVDSAVTIDATDGKLIVRRADDSRRSRGVHGLVRKLVANMEVYERQSAPVYDHFRARGLLREVDGTGSSEEVFGKILRQLQKTE